jgi:hypothetical protein
VLGRHQHGTAPLAADRDALRDPQHDEQHRRERPDLLVGGQQADEHARDAHQAHREDEHPLAADPVAVVAEEGSAERPGEVAGGEGAETRDRADDRVERGEEDLVEHHRRGRGVQQEVVVLDDAAQVARRNRAPKLGARTGFGHAGGLSARGPSAANLGT